MRSLHVRVGVTEGHQGQTHVGAYEVMSNGEYVIHFCVLFCFKGDISV